MFRTPLIFSIAFFGASALASTFCPEHFVNGKPPAITNPKLQSRTQEICFEAFAVLHSGISRTPLYSAEHLTRQNLEAAKDLSRKDSFHAESALPASERAELSDYARSGYDRGHMSPNANFSNRTAQAQSFSLANMVPQAHTNNTGVWAGIEATVRRMAMDEGELYVISGPAFIGDNLKQVGNVLVPTHIWKVVYSPLQQRAGAYLVTNDETRDYSALSVSDLQKLVGVNVLPGASEKLRNGGMDLPRPLSQGGSRKRRKSTDTAINPADGQHQGGGGFTLRDFSRAIIDAIQRASH